MTGWDLRESQVTSHRRRFGFRSHARVQRSGVGVQAAGAGVRGREEQRAVPTLAVRAHAGRELLACDTRAAPRRCLRLWRVSEVDGGFNCESPPFLYSLYQDCG
eukprot:2850175-Rhodomonas_salina.2